MDKKTRIGSDPLRWIRDTREETEKRKRSLQDKQSKQDLQINKQEGKPTQRVITKTSQGGLKEGWTRATFIVREEHLEKLKALAYWERKQLKELVDEVLGSYLKSKKVKPVKKREEK